MLGETSAGEFKLLRIRELDNDSLDGKPDSTNEDTPTNGDCSLVRRFCSPKVRKSEIKGSSFRRFCSPKVRKSDDDFYSFLL